MFDLLEHRYQDRWLKEQRKSELAKQHKEDERKKSSTAKSYYETRACRLRRFSPPVDSSPLWQMPRFQKVSMHTCECKIKSNVKVEKYLLAFGMNFD